MANMLLVLTSIVLVFSQVHAQFVTRNGKDFMLNGQKFNFGGANAYYILTKPKPMVDDLFARASEMGVTVIRVWGFAVAGNVEGGSWPYNVQKDTSVYFHYWNTKTGKPDFNDGPNGLEHLDYILKKANDYGIKLLLPLTNNWGAFGGAEQMNLWYGLNCHEDFYTNAQTKQAYKDWVEHLLWHKNKFTGVMYRDDPAILGLELVNEARIKGCKDTGDCADCAPCKKGCGSDESLITSWVNEMASFVKDKDGWHHLVGVGDEGFFYKWSSDWGYDGQDGTTESFVALDKIDFATVHTYPDAWGRDQWSWTSKWISDHLFIANKYNKPFIMEEFGWRNYGGEGQANWARTDREAIFDNWTKQICSANGNWVFWMLGARQYDNDWDTPTSDAKGKLFPDFDHYTIYYKDQNGQVTPGGKAMQDRIWRTKTGKC